MPGMSLPPDYGKDIQNEVWGLGVPRDVFLGITFFADEGDVEQLRALLACGKVSGRHFERFCLDKGLPADVENQDSAAAFFEFVFGRVVAWVHIPEGEGSAALLQQVTAVLERFNLAVVSDEWSYPPFRPVARGIPDFQ